jgi:hypothetical protein
VSSELLFDRSVESVAMTRARCPSFAALVRQSITVWQIIALQPASKRTD